MEKDIAALCSAVKDFRVNRTKKYPLGEILFSAFVAVICGAKSWDEIAGIALANLESLRKWMPFKNGIPSHDTYNRVFSLLDPKALGNLLSGIYEILKRNDGREDHICIDGKCLRGSGSEIDGKKAVYLLNAWSAKNKICLAQERVSDKSNEKTAIPELISSIDCRGAVVTIDAGGTYADIAAKIVEKGGKYLLALKGNQPSLYEGAKEMFSSGRITETFKEPICSKGYVHEYTAEVIRGRRVEAWRDRWQGITSIIRITKQITHKRTGKVTEEQRFYISSARKSAEEFHRLIMGHWDIERELHWMLDVEFNEDSSRRRGKAAENMSIMNKLAISVLKYVKQASPEYSRTSIRFMRWLCSHYEDILQKTIASFNKRLDA